MAIDKQAIYACALRFFSDFNIYCLGIRYFIRCTMYLSDSDTYIIYIRSDNNNNNPE